MRIVRLSLRNFRTYERAEVRLAPGITVVAGRNGAGKSNLLEAVYFACTGRSCRTANERECVRFGAGVLRLELTAEGRDGAHQLTVGFQPGEASETIPVPFSGDPLEIGFNPDFLRDGLESVDSGDVLLKLISPLRPGMIEAGDESGFQYLLMPIRLNV